MAQTTFPVSCKAILYNQDHTKVLVAEYGPGFFGLPGGHIDDDELPDEAVRRELVEELGLYDIRLAHSDFFRHPDGRIVLFYVGVIDESTELLVDPTELSAAIWASLDDIQSGAVDIDAYRDFVLAAREKMPKLQR